MNEKLDPKLGSKRSCKQPTMAPTQDCPSRHKSTYKHHAKQKKEDENRHIDYNIEDLRRNPEQLKRCIKTTPLYEQYTRK